MIKHRLLVVAVALVTACAARHAPAADAAPPAALLGNFTDDYGGQYQISATEWRHGTRTLYRIVRWNVAAQYLIAQNDVHNPGDGGLWTRIDWVDLPGMPPYRWGYCYSAFQEATAAAAESVTVAQRAKPRTGCNGHPFSRMKPAAP